MTKTKIKSKTIIEPETKMVITVTGDSFPRSQCRKIEGCFYKLGDVKKQNSGDCYEITHDGKTTVYRAKNPNLIWDYTDNCYCLREDKHINGIVDFDAKTKRFINGYFQLNIYNNIFMSGQRVISAEPLRKAGMSFNPMKNVWESSIFVQKAYSSTAINEGISKIIYESFSDSFYSTSEHSFFKKSQQLADDWAEKNIADSVFDRFFDRYTIGVEAETCAGNIPENYLFRTGLLPLRDGSIVGHEFTSTVIGSKYFGRFKEIFEQLSKNCFTNQNCSLHYHFGNIPKSKEFTVSLWMLYYRLQDSIESLCPPYKRDLHYLTKKRVSSGTANGIKDHCKRLPNLFPSLKITNIDEAFDMLLTFFNDNQLPAKSNSSNLIFKHRKEGRPKWDYEARYYAINFIPFLFEEGKQTIEFRFHSGTVNFYKAFAWALICSALLQYAEINMERIFEGKEKIRLIDVISVLNDGTPESNFLVLWLSEYISERSLSHQKLVIKNDIFGKEFYDDNNYTFTVNGMSPLNYSKKQI